MSQQKPKYKTPQEKMIEDWRDIIREYLKSQPMYVQARHIGPEFFKNYPEFFPAISSRGKTVHFGVLLGSECTVYASREGPWVCVEKPVFLW